MIIPLALCYRRIV